MKEYPNLVKDMKNSEHNYDLENPNPYHLEDVWTHTMMVCNQAEKNTKDIHVYLSALLHDIGKPNSRLIKEDFKVAFYNHENLSTYMAIDILYKFKNDFKDINIDIIRILQLINWHSDFHKIGEINENGDVILSNNDKTFINSKYNDKTLYLQSVLMNEADNNGRFGNNNKNQDNKIKFDFLKKYNNNNFDDSLKKQYINNNIEKAEVLMLIGIAGVGKSTIRDELIKHKDYVVLSTDDIIMEMYPNKTYSEAFKESNTKEDGWKSINIEFDRRMKEAIKNNKNIILDQQNLTKKSRTSKLNQFNNKKYIKKAIVVLAGKNIHETLLKNRKIIEGKNIPAEIIDMNVKRFSLPGFEEFEDIKYLINDNIDNKLILVNKLNILEKEKKIEVKLDNNF
jgi:putative nucleotidyltransferase with HDIG domain